MKEVILHLYDVTNSDSVNTNNTIVQINKIFKDRIGLGGIFHSAIEIYGDEEWSFGFCPGGTGVFSCAPGKNLLYTYRECIVLGMTDLSVYKVNQILRELRREWPGQSYDLLSKNCNHFCDEFLERLGMPKLPGWVNRFAHTGDTAAEIAGNAALRLQQAKSEIVSGSKVAYNFLLGSSTSNSTTGTNSNIRKDTSTSYPLTWFKSIVVTPFTTSSELENNDVECSIQHKQQEKACLAG